MKFLLAILVLLISGPLSAKEEILWVKWTLVPEYIESGDFQGQGYLDQFLAYVQDRLPEYDHKEEFQTLNRISRSWSNGNVCSLHLWLGYWPDKIVYSKPYGFTPRFGIVTPKDSKLAQEFRGKKSISLKYLLAHTDYQMGMLPLFYEGSKDSRYPLLVPIIEPYLGSSKVREFSNNRNEVSVAYLDKNRVDYTLRMSITHFSELKTNNLEDKYQFFFLDEGRQHKLVASACSNSDFGKEVIRKINSLIDEEFYLRYLKFRQEWDGNNPSFDSTFIDYFIHKKPVKFVSE